jgi:anti-sigma factor RsiW
MPTSRFPEISDELLSAYIDHAVSEAERRLVEEAVQQDASVAWRLGTLTETVRLLRSLPLLAAPRSFVLTPEQASQPVRLAATTEEASPPLPRWKTWLEEWRRFWQRGSPLWRGALAGSMALWLLTLVVPAFGLPARSLHVSSPPAGALAAPSAPEQRTLAAESEALESEAIESEALESEALESEALPQAPASAADLGRAAAKRAPLVAEPPLAVRQDEEAQLFPGWLAGVQGGLAGAVLLSALGWWRSRRSG